MSRFPIRLINYEVSDFPTPCEFVSVRLIIAIKLMHKNRDGIVKWDFS